MTPTARRRCPGCGGAIARLVFGMPTLELVEQSDRGEVALGGCPVEEGDDAKWECLDCGLRCASGPAHTLVLARRQSDD